MVRRQAGSSSLPSFQDSRTRIARSLAVNVGMTRCSLAPMLIPLDLHLADLLEGAFDLLAQCRSERRIRFREPLRPAHAL